MPKEKIVTILITDDHQLFRRSLQMVLQKMPGVQVVGEAENGQQAFEKVGELKPDIVIMDVHMPVLDGITATRRIKETYMNTIVIALSNDIDDYHKQEMKDAGATDYLSKSINIKDLERSIRHSLLIA